MIGFGENLNNIKETEYVNIFEISEESKSIMKDLFKDDFDGVEEIEPLQEVEVDVDSKIAELFSDDYSEETEVTQPEEEQQVDLTKQYEPNTSFEVDGQTYETDDRGYIYKVDGYELLPDCEYTIGGETYKTDKLGRIVSCEGNATLTPEGERDNKAQAIAGGEDRREGDQGGHILARIFGGAKGVENMVAMRGTAINQSVYKRMENEIARALEEDKEVNVQVDIEYEGDSQRPSKIIVKYTIDGKETIVQFDNDEGSTDLLDTLEEKVYEEQYNDLKQEIHDANEDGAEMSVVSIKTECDKDGNPTKITVTIRDENSDYPVNEYRVLNLRG